MHESTASLNKLLNPRAIAVVGASATPGKVGYEVMRALSGAAARIIPVHPKAAEILGKAVVNDISDLPEDVDLAVVATGADIAVVAAEQCARKRVPFVVVLASGFSEVGEEGAVREERLSAVARETGCRIMGPNTLGLQVPATGVDTIFVDHATDAVAGGSTVLVSQSGSVAVEALLAAVRYGFGIRAFFGLGNKADLSEIDFLDHFAEDPDTGIVGLYIEDLSAGRDFLSRARAIAPKKPVLAIKAGRTAAGATAASSHTGRLSGSDRVIDGALRQYLVQRVSDDEELCDAAKVLEHCPVPRGNRVAILSPAGGYGVMLADLVETQARGAELRVAKLSDGTSAALKECLLGFASVKNPVDLTASVNDDTFLESLRHVLADDGVDIVICVFFLAPPGITTGLTGRLSRLLAGTDKPVVLLAGDEDGTGVVLRDFHAAGIAAFPSLARTIGAVRNLERRRGIVERAAIGATANAGAAAGAAGAADAGGSPGFATWPANEKQVKEAIISYGIRVPHSVLEPATAKAGAAARGGADGDSALAPGFPGPYVVKVSSPDVQHKTEAGGVRLGVTSDELAAAVREMQQRFPGADVLVEEMVSYSGIEIIVGAFTDPELGPAVMLGAGGVLAELHEDVTFRLLPCTDSDVHQMIDELTVAPVFKGYRGLPDIADELVQLVMGVSRFVSDLGAGFRELDLNPVVCGPEGLVALDAVLVVDPE